MFILQTLSKTLQAHDADLNPAGILMPRKASSRSLLPPSMMVVSP